MPSKTLLGVLHDGWIENALLPSLQELHTLGDQKAAAARRRKTKVAQGDTGL
jgi:hypothetical protein